MSSSVAQTHDPAFSDPPCECRACENRRQFAAAEQDSPAVLGYQTNRWGGVEGRYHFEIHIDGRTAMLTIDRYGLEIFAPQFLTFDEGCLAANHARLRFVTNFDEVRYPLTSERQRTRRKLADWLIGNLDPHDAGLINGRRIVDEIDRICPKE